MMLLSQNYELISAYHRHKRSFYVEQFDDGPGVVFSLQLTCCYLKRKSLSKKARHLLVLTYK